MSDLSIDDLVEAIRAQLQEAYVRGARDERARILRIASDTSQEARTSTAPTSKGRSSARVAHGTIRPLVRQVLAEQPGLTKVEIGRRVVQLDSRVSAISVVNELQRNDVRKHKGHRLYRRKGDRWFLVEEEPLTETAGIAEDDHPPIMNGAG